MKIWNQLYSVLNVSSEEDLIATTPVLKNIALKGLGNINNDNNNTFVISIRVKLTIIN
jgi:hypothetical protein